MSAEVKQMGESKASIKASSKSIQQLKYEVEVVA